jgi:uncharacterized membrane protein
MVLDVAELAAIMASALVAGVFWGPWVGLTRSIAGFDPQVFLAIGERMNRNLGPLMRVLIPASLLLTVLVLVLSVGDRPVAFALTLAGFALFVLALVVTLVVEVPIAKRIATWTVATLPGDWQRQRDRWASVHVVRVASGIVGLALLVGAAIFG